MFRKSLGAAAVVTLIAALPLYVITTTVAPLPLAPTTILLALIFLASLASAWLDSRLQQKTRQRGRKRSRRRQDSSADKAQREQGTVKWFNAAKGFGFITRDNGEDVFVHFRGIRGKGRRVLRDGQRVEYSVTQTSKGLQAEDVATL